MESENHKGRSDSEDPGSRDSISLSSHSMSEISKGSFKDEAPEWLSISTGSEENSCRSSAEEKNLSEKSQNADNEPEAVLAYGHVNQPHLSQHTGAWDSIARVNEEILLTMLDIYENFKSKALVCTTTQYIFIY